jgi:hypothetical protein
MEDEQNRAVEVSEADFLDLVFNVPGLQLVILSGPHTAKSVDQRGTARLASKIVARGVPACVAMLDSLTPDAASRFTARLYRVLALSFRRRTAIDDAVNEARGQVVLHDRTRWDWAMPTLFMRGSGVLFVPTAGQRGQLASVVPTAVTAPIRPAPEPEEASIRQPEALPTPIAMQEPQRAGYAGQITLINTIDVRALAAKEDYVNRSINSGGGNVIANLGDKASMSNIAQTTVTIPYNKDEFIASLDTILDGLRPMVAENKAAAEAVKQLEAARAGADADDPPEGLKSRIEKVGGILDGARDLVKSGLGLAAALGKAAAMVGAVIAWL